VGAVSSCAITDNDRDDKLPSSFLIGVSTRATADNGHDAANHDHGYADRAVSTCATAVSNRDRRHAGRLDRQ
jgi:hypothetical protein